MCRTPSKVAVKIEIALYATLTQYLPPGGRNRKAVIEVAEGSTVREVMSRLGIPGDVSRILMVNGRLAREDTVLKDGETLSLVPPLAGGARQPLAPSS